MLYKSRSPVQGFVRVIFELPSSVWADRICLAGDFNDWKQNDIHLQQIDSGKWQVSMDLPEGRRYEFCYIIDGQWRTDYHADYIVDYMDASQNSIVITDIHNLPPLPDATALISAN
jgi:1,4-alpha-glucan branching enzyme